MNKKRNGLLIFLKNLFTPFSLLILLSSLSSLIASYFAKNGYSKGLILLFVYLFSSISFSLFEFKHEDYNQSKLKKAYIDISKLSSCFILFGIAVIVISSLLYHVDIINMIYGASNLFIILLPLGHIPLLLFSLKNDLDNLFNLYKKIYLDFLPILVSEFLISILLPLFGLGFAFNSNEILLVNFALIFLIYLFDLLKFNNKDLKQNEITSKSNRLIISIICGLLFSFVLFISYLIPVFQELNISSSNINLNNITNILKNENDVFESAQNMIFVSMYFGAICYLYFYCGSIKDYFNSKNYLKSVFTLLAIIIGIVFIFIPWFKSFIYSSYSDIYNLLYAILLGFLLLIFSFLGRLIPSKKATK